LILGLLIEKEKTRKEVKRMTEDSWQKDTFRTSAHLVRDIVSFTVAVMKDGKLKDGEVEMMTQKTKIVVQNVQADSLEEASDAFPEIKENEQMKMIIGRKIKLLREDDTEYREGGEE